MYYLRIKSDKHNRRWKVREAVSINAAYDEISHAMVLGSVGGKSTVSDGKKTIVLADVVRVNPDNSEVRPS